MKLEIYKLFNAIFILGTTSLVLIIIMMQPHVISVKLYTLSLAVIVYLVWALIYHRIDKSLTWIVFLEYLLTALLSLVLFAGIF